MSSHDHEIDTLAASRAVFAYSTEKKKRNLPELDKLTPIERSVLGNLITRRNNTSFQCNPSISLISEDLGCSKRHVSTGLLGLKNKGIIRVTSKRKPYSKEKTSSQYWILFDIDTIHSAFDDGDTNDFMQSKHTEIHELYEHEWKNVDC